MSFSQHFELPDSLLPVGVPTLSAVLVCDGEPVVAEIALGVAPKPLNTVTDRLVKQLAARLCH